MTISVQTIHKHASVLRQYFCCGFLRFYFITIFPICPFCVSNACLSKYLCKIWVTEWPHFGKYFCPFLDLYMDSMSGVCNFVCFSHLGLLRKGLWLLLRWLHLTHCVPPIGVLRDRWAFVPPAKAYYCHESLR